VNEKLGRALRRLNTRSGSLGKRVRDAWEEMHVLVRSAALLCPLPYVRLVLHETRELYVIGADAEA